MGKQFIDPKMSEILSVIPSFSLYDANYPFLAKTAPCPFPESLDICSFEILAEVLVIQPQLMNGAAG
jgi:hypothetical protein